MLFRTNTQPRQLIEQLMSYNIPFKTKDNIPNIYRALDCQRLVYIPKNCREAAGTELIFADYEQTKAVSVKRQPV